MDYPEAETRFRRLEDQLRAGQINEPQYKAALAELRVVDAAGITWMLQEHTGAWFVYQNGAWRAAQPPRPSAPATPPPAPAPVASPYPQPYPAPAATAYPQPYAAPAPALAVNPYPQPQAQSAFQPQAQAQFQPALGPLQDKPRGSVAGKYFKYFLIWLVAWAVIGAVVYIFFAKGRWKCCMASAWRR